MSLGYAGDLKPKEAWELLEGDTEAQLIDVRTDAEWAYVGRADLPGLERQVHYISWQVFPAMERNANFLSEISARGFGQDQPLALSLPLRRALDACRHGAERGGLTPAATMWPRASRATMTRTATAATSVVGRRLGCPGFRG